MRRRTVVAGAVTAAVVVSGAFIALAAVIGFGGGTSGASAPPSNLPPETAEVTRETLRDTESVDGTLGYGDVVPVSAAQQGTLTWLAPVGGTVYRGKPLFKVDQQPVVALYGSLPLYRELRVDVEGPDVELLERNLRELGYQDTAGFTVDEDFTDATAAAVEAWQEDLGLTETGSVKPGDLVFVPSAVRVSEHSGRVGGQAGGEVLSYTGTAREVTVELEVADQRMAKKGAKVSVELPGGETVSGTVREVATVAAAAEDDGDAPGQEGDSAGDATLEVTVRIADQKKLGDLDGGPVDVTFTSGTRKDVLAVPVSALLALAEGGYGVEVVDGRSTRIVAVDTGLFAGGLVEVSGDGIDEGTTVGVAA